MNVTYNINMLKIGSLEGASVVSIGYTQHDSDLDEHDDEPEGENEELEGIKS